MSTVDIFNIFTYSFFQNSLIAALILSIVLPIIGVIVYMRKILFLADTLGQVSLAGASISLYLSTIISFFVQSEWFIILFTVLASLFIQFLIDRVKESQQVSLLLTHGVAVSLVIIFLNLSEKYSSSLFSLLFGNISAVSSKYIITVLVVSIVVFIILALNYKNILMCIIDNDLARIYGVNVTFYRYLTIALISVVIALCTKVVGVMLVSIVLAVPLLAANLVSKSLVKTVLIATLITFICFIFGIFSGYMLDVSANAMVVIATLGVYLSLLVVKSKR